MGSITFVIKLWEETTYFLQNSALKAYWKHHFRSDGVDFLAIDHNLETKKTFLFLKIWKNESDQKIVHFWPSFKPKNTEKIQQKKS